MVRFGLLIPQEGVAFDVVRAHARLAESLGFDSVWVEDHLRVIAVPAGSPAYEGWTTLTALLASTERIRCGPLVLAEGFRNPALLASMASTVDHLSGGRLNLGVGAGGYRAEYDSFGFEWLPSAERVARLDEYLSVVNAMWRRETFRGRYYACDGTADCPAPFQRPRPPIVVGGAGDATLRVAATHADVWNGPLLSVEQMGERVERLDGLSRALGRDRPDVSWYGPCWLDEDGERSRGRIARAQASGDRTVALYGRVAIGGTPEQVVSRLRAYEAAGVEEFILHFGRADVTAGTELFAREVFPAFR